MTTHGPSSVSPAAAASCAHCRTPLDSRCFDMSGFGDPPDVGGSLRLARFELPHQYCGVLEYFAQFTDASARDPARVETPGLLWLVLVNGRPLDPYLDLQAIVNPWGNGSFPIWIRLDPASTVELVVRGVARAAPGHAAIGDEIRDAAIARIGGRLVGRYWYDESYGDVVRRRS